MSVLIRMITVVALALIVATPLNVHGKESVSILTDAGIICGDLHDDAESDSAEKINPIVPLRVNLNIIPVTDTDLSKRANNSHCPMKNKSGGMHLYHCQLPEFCDHAGGDNSDPQLSAYDIIGLCDLTAGEMTITSKGYQAKFFNYSSMQTLPTIPPPKHFQLITIG